MDWLPFQKRFQRAAHAPGIRLACLCLPRGNGKSTLIAHEAKAWLDEGSGLESHIIASSVGQARRTVFKILRQLCSDNSQFKIAESPNQAHIVDRATGTKISILAANHKTAQGLVDVPRIWCDEPGSWEAGSGAAVWAAIRTAQGKPGVEMHVTLLGTLGPALSGWWHDVVKRGSRPGVHVLFLQGNGGARSWDNWQNIRACNPLMAKHAQSRAVLLDERNEARLNPRLKADFRMYRLNEPVRGENEAVLTDEELDILFTRRTPAREGRFWLGVDLGQSRAWSAAVAIWQNGHIEAVATCPGIPSIELQEKRDTVERGTYQRLVDAGLLHPSEGRHVPAVEELVALVQDRFGSPERVVADHFKAEQLKDAAPGWIVDGRRRLWKESTEDVEALKKRVLDGPFAVDPGSVPLLAHGLKMASLEHDTTGNFRITKGGSHNTERDDPAAALAVAAGLWEREREFAGGVTAFVA